MSDPEHESEQWRLSIQDMILFCESIVEHTEGIDLSTLVGTRLIYDATLWNITLLGEAASNVPATIRDIHPDIPWGIIVAARNRIIHRYWRIDSDIIWDIARNDVPSLLPRLRRLLESTHSGQA